MSPIPKTRRVSRSMRFLKKEKPSMPKKQKVAISLNTARRAGASIPKPTLKSIKLRVGAKIQSQRKATHKKLFGTSKLPKRGTGMIKSKVEAMKTKATARRAGMKTKIEAMKARAAERRTKLKSRSADVRTRIDKKEFLNRNR